MYTILVSNDTFFGILRVKTEYDCLTDTLTFV